MATLAYKARDTQGIRYTVFKPKIPSWFKDTCGSPPGVNDGCFVFYKDNM